MHAANLHRYLLVGIIVIGAVLRLFFLQNIPHSVNGDELHYLLSAKAFVLTGKDISQSVTPLDILIFHYPPGELVQAELPYFLDMLSVGVLPFSLLGNALPTAMLGISMILIMYLLTKELFKKNELALICALLTAINPWFIIMSRTSYEMIPATFFFLFAFYLFIKLKSWKILWTMPILLLFFYSYIATKLIFLPLLITMLLYCYLFINKKQYGKQYVIVFSFSVLLVVFYLFQLHHYPQTSRFTEILTPNNSSISQEVDALRRATIANPMLSLFENKYGIYFKIILGIMFSIFSPYYLFLQGDYFFSLFQHGIFYPIDFLFLLVGGVWLFIEKKRVFWLLSMLSFISILPHILHYQAQSINFTPHILLLIPLFIMMIGYGIWKIFALLHHKKYRYIMIFVGMIYCFSLGNFVTIYFFQMPLEHDFYNFPDRILSEYIGSLQTAKIPAVIYLHTGRALYEENIFYNNLYNRQNAQRITVALRGGKYSMGNVQVTSCDKSVSIPQKDVTTIVEDSCGMSATNENIPSIIPQLSDSGAVYTIYNDKICQRYALQHYISHVKLTDFYQAQSSIESFCSNFFIRY